MKRNSKFSEQISLNPLLNIIIILAILGSSIELLGFMWDASSHIMSKPDTFWSIQHDVVYGGMGMFVTSAILGALVCTKNSIDKRLRKGIIIIIVGALIAVISGYIDWTDHMEHGLAAQIVSLPHIGIEAGPAVATFGGFLALREKNDKKLNKLVPIAILSITLSLAGAIFNFALFFYGPIICLDVHYLFYSGCEIR